MRQDVAACFAESFSTGGIARETFNTLLPEAWRARHDRLVVLGIAPFDQPAVDRGTGLVRRYLEAAP